MGITEFRTTVTQNQTMSADHVEQFVSQNVSTLTDNLNQTKSFYDLADMPLPNITYVLFGLVCIITVVCLFGNSLTLTIMIKLQDKPLKGNDILISALAVFDGMVLIPTAISNPIVYNVIGRDIRAISTIGCKVFNCIWSSALVSSYTVVILICIERFVAVWCPLRARYILSRKFVIKCLLISVITVPMMYVSAVVLYSEIEDKICITNFAGTVYSSVLKGKPNTTVLNAAIGFNLALYLAILYILTPMILVKLYKQRVTRRRLTHFENMSV